MTAPQHDMPFLEALGRATLGCWAALPQDIQRRLFEGAVSEGPAVRQALAVYLHQHHPRTGGPDDLDLVARDCPL